MGDLLRFVTIYMVFVMGFSQAYYIVFLTFDNSEEEEPEPEFNPISSPMESFISMFLMSLGNFGDYYGGMEFTGHELQAKVSTSHLSFIYVNIINNFFFTSDTVRFVYGNCGRASYQHVDRYDGKYLHKDCGDEKRMATTMGSNRACRWA